MKTVLYTIVLIIFLITSTLPFVLAQDNSVNGRKDVAATEEAPLQAKQQFTVEIDPLVFFLGGIGGHFGWTPKNNKHFTYGVGFVAGPEFPEAFNNMNSKNKGQGWNIKVNQGASIWIHYYFKQPNKGWFSGLQLITQEVKLTNDDYPGQSDLTNTLLLNLSAGYVFYPIKKINLFLRPWAGIALQKTIKTSFEPDMVNPEMVIGDKEYDLSGILPFATVHLGYRF